MFNRIRTLEVFGYDIDLDKKSRRSKEEHASTNGTLKKHLMVIDNCPSCTMEREIQLRNSRKNKLCSKCFHNTPEMVKAKQNQNKVKTEEHKQKMRDNHWSTKGGTSAFKGKTHTDETKNKIAKSTYNQNIKTKLSMGEDNYKIAMSCMSQRIPIEDFIGFTSPENTLIRQSPEGKAWSYDVLVKANFTCEKCHERGGSLNSHHKNAFNAFPEQRFDVNNGACLCAGCHNDFHSKYGKGSNTEEQFTEWLNSKPTVYLLVGAPASGKSWVANQLTDKFDYVSYDGNSKKHHLDLLKSPSTRPKLYDPTFKISTIIRRHSNEFNFILVAIYEEESVLRDRMILRGGTWTDTVMKRNKVAKKRHEEYGINGFVGTSQEALEFLKGV